MISANMSETYEPLNYMQEYETWEEYHFCNTEIYAEVSVVFLHYYL